MVRIITDSTCDLTQSRQAALKIEVAPLSVRFGEESFLDGEEITNQEFYCRRWAADSRPATSQVNPDVFAQLFRRHVEAGDQVVGIFIASQLSGTYQSACIARDMVDEKHIFVVDSDTVTFGLGLLVEHAVTLRDQGMSAGEIAAEIQRLSQRVRLLAVVGTLKDRKSVV